MFLNQWWCILCQALQWFYEVCVFKQVHGHSAKMVSVQEQTSEGHEKGYMTLTQTTRATTSFYLCSFFWPEWFFGLEKYKVIEWVILLPAKSVLAQRISESSPSESTAWTYTVTLNQNQTQRQQTAWPNVQKLITYSTKKAMKASIEKVPVHPPPSPPPRQAGIC